MRNKHKILTVLLVILLCAAMVIGLVACNPPQDNDDKEKDSGKFISNGNFNMVSGDEYPKSVSNWSGKLGDTSSENKPQDNDSDEDIVAHISGAINTDDEYYNAYSDNWDKTGNPGATGEDNKVLMIYNKLSTSYGYRSNSISLGANKVFKITVDARVRNTEGNAYITITGSTYKQFAVPSSERWNTYTFYISTGNSSQSIYVGLSNGYRGKNNGMLSKGYAFFDNVTVTEVEDTDDKTAEEIFNEVALSETVDKADLIIGDADFINISGNTNPYTAAKWQNVTSKGTGNDSSTAPTNSDTLEKGIVDLSAKPDWVNTGLSTDDLKDSFVLFINNKKSTAFGMRNDTKIRFNSGKYYKLSINVATFLADNAPADAGAYVRLMNSTTAGDILLETEVIDTDGAWQTVSFYIEADAMRVKDYYFEVALGKGGANDVLNVTGQAFFDSLTLEEIDKSVYDNMGEGDEYNYKKSIATTDDGNDNMFEQHANDVNDWLLDEIAYKDFAVDFEKYYKGNLEYKPVADYANNPGLPFNADDNRKVYRISNDNATVNIRMFNNDGNNYTIEKNKYYRLGMWVKTQDIDKAKGLNISLFSQKTPETSLESEKSLRSSIASVTGFNTENAKSNATAGNNDYVEIVFLIEGAALEDSQVFLQLSLGSGNFSTPATFVKGSAYISDITLYEIDYAGYNSESGSYVEKHSFKESGSSSIANANFDSVNQQATAKAYALDGDDGDGLIFEDGILKNALGIPSDWTYDNEVYLKSLLHAGIINYDSDEMWNTLANNADIDINELKNNLYNGLTGFSSSNNANLLALGTVKGDTAGAGAIQSTTKQEVCGCTAEICAELGYCDKSKHPSDSRCLHTAVTGEISPWGFTSPSISLEQNSYYMISVWAKVAKGSASISLSSSSHENRIIEINEAGEWQQYIFYIETGFDSVSVNLDLFLGIKDSDNTVSGLAFFDMPTLVSIDKDTYEAGVKNELPEIDSVSYTISTFDNVTSVEDSLSTPNNWSGSHADSDAPAEDKDVVSGVYNIKHHNRNWFGKDDDTRISEEGLNAIYGNNNENALVINNNVNTEYQYSHTLSKDLEKESYYKISVDVYTYNVIADQFATISLKLENAESYTFGKNADNGVLVNTEYDLNGKSLANGWRTYTYYVKTPASYDVDTAILTLSLGTEDEDNYAKGYAFFDNVAISKIDADEFTEANDEFKKEGENNTFKANNIVIEFTDEMMDQEAEDDDDDTDPLLWLYIVSGIIGGLVVIVAFVYVGKRVYNKYFRKIANARRKQKNTASYDREKLNKTSSKKDDSNLKG